MKIMRMQIFQFVYLLSFLVNSWKFSWLAEHSEYVDYSAFLLTYLNPEKIAYGKNHVISLEAMGIEKNKMSTFWLMIH